MADDPERYQSGETLPMPIGKAISGLVVIYALIAGPAIWKIRQTCLLLHDNCGTLGLVEWVLSDRLTLIGSLLLLSVLLFITWHFIGLIRHGKPDPEEDVPERKFNISGLMVSLVVFVLYLGGSMAVILSATSNPGLIDLDNPSIYFWKIMGPILGSTIVYTALWHLNDYFVKPVSNIVLLVLFLITVGSIYLFIQSAILNY